MPEGKKPIFSNIAAVYFDFTKKMSVSFKRGLIGKSGYACKSFPGLTACFGCEGDIDAPIAFIDGSYRLRGRGDVFITFGVSNIEGKINWYNKEGFLPCFVSEFSKGGVDYSVENYASRVEFGGNPFEIVYSRLTVKNNTASPISLPKVSKLLVPLNNAPQSVAPGERAMLDYAVAADRFGGKYKYPSRREVATMGSFDEQYEAMKQYWLTRLEPLAEIVSLPDEKLINAYKAGYIYTMIVKDGDRLHVGENGYDRVFDHDVLGILASLVTMGDFRHFKEYAKHILMNLQYPDARWKYSWIFALYLQKTGDTEYLSSQLDDIKTNAHSIARDREDGGIMKRTNAIDSHGSWTIDNQSALTGLCCYEYICRTLGIEDEALWARQEYDSLLNASNAVLSETISKYNLDYIPIAMNEPNEAGPRCDPRDANWASMFLFGRWSWDAYLFCARQDGVMLDLIDSTYSRGFERRNDISDTIYNFGGYPHGYFCSAYNAGYGSAALRGEKYRDSAIKAYQFMINCAQSGPFSWWEGVGYPDKASPWSIDHAATGGGSCQHIWGQSTATKALYDSLICERSNGDVIIGRGIPREWLYDGAEIEIKKYPLANNRRMGYKLNVSGNSIAVTLTGDAPIGTVSAQLPYADGFEIKVSR